jgi:DNA polymerase III epsilon subunit-like protein
MRVCIWDLETTGLTAIMGRILTCAFVGLDDAPTVFRLDAKAHKGKNKLDDAKLAVAIRDRLEQADLIVGHNIRLFDIAFLNARLAKAGERPLNTHFVLDTMWAANRMRIGSRKLDNLQKFFALSEAKTPLSWETWQLAAQGDARAMDEVVEHNIADVLVTRELYPVVLPHVATLHR